jgi:type II secretory pathway component PulF
VLPQFRTLYESAGARLPAFTEFVIGSGWLLAPVLALLIAAAVLFLVGISKVKMRLQVLAPMRPLLGRVPGIKAWARDHDVSLWMRYVALLLDAGATPETSAAVATALAGEPGRDHRPRLLSSAATLGRLREELARLLDEDAREAVARFEEPRNGLVIGLRVLIYLIVSTYLVAMYLPIFKLGSII